MYTKLSIPERLKDLRVVDKHLTLEQLAEQTGLSKSALGKYESDDYKDISPFAIATLAKFYGVSTDYLMGVSENKNHPNTELQALHLSDATAVHFGAILLVNMSVGFMTPPFALGTFVGTKITGAGYGETVKESIPFMIVGLVAIIITTCFPEYVMFFVNILS